MSPWFSIPSWFLLLMSPWAVNESQRWLLQWCAVTAKCKPNKPVPPQICFRPWHESWKIRKQIRILMIRCLCWVRWIGNMEAVKLYTCVWTEVLCTVIVTVAHYNRPQRRKEKARAWGLRGLECTKSSLSLLPAPKSELTDLLLITKVRPIA